MVAKSDAELTRLPASVVGGAASRRRQTAAEAIAEPRRLYSATSGYEIDHISSAIERDWPRTCQA